MYEAGMEQDYIISSLMPMQASKQASKKQLDTALGGRTGM